MEDDFGKELIDYGVKKHKIIVLDVVGELYREIEDVEKELRGKLESYFQDIKD